MNVLIMTHDAIVVNFVNRKILLNLKSVVIPIIDFMRSPLLDNYIYNYRL